VHCVSHSDHDPTQSIDATLGAGVGVAVGSGVGSTVLGAGVGCVVHAPSAGVQVNVTSLGFGQFSPLMRWIFTQSTPHSVNCSSQCSHGATPHTSCSPWLYSQSAPLPCFVTEMLYTFEHSSSQSDHDPTQSRDAAVGAGVGVGVGSGVGSDVGVGVGGAVHFPSPTTQSIVTSLGVGHFSPKMR
jgi:hypothetical protein